MNTINKRIFSGIQPTNTMHIGNYFGAIANWVKLEDEYECIYSVVDLHALTISFKPNDLRENTHNMFVDLLACGINPEKSVLFIQSNVVQHSELAWIFNCLTPYGELGRMTQFKEKSEQILQDSKDNFISAGLYTYPVLQAADILLYKAGFVPVGKDQEQHLELSRNIAVRFNHVFGKFFPEPKPLFTEVPKLMSLADPVKKMSKSLGPKHYIALFEPEEEIRKKIRSAVTDLGPVTEGEMSAGVKNLFELLNACKRTDLSEPLLRDHASGNLRYKDLKDAVSDSLTAFLNPIRTKREELVKDKSAIDKYIKIGAEKASAIASDNMKEIKKLIGLPG